MQLVFLNDNNDDFKFISNITNKFGLGLSFIFADFDKKDNKTLKRIANENPDTPILFFYNHNLILAILENNELVKVSPDWQSYQSRIVKAGKNSELLLRIAKLNSDMTVIDGTAGFGIDGLLLASTGAKLILIEKNPILFLMLMAEKRKMSENKNWQKLMSRIEINFGDSSDVLADYKKVDIIYIDPMFPNNSYKSLVNKNMQVLHVFIAPPSIKDEIKLFNAAIAHCEQLIIKRPISAPNFANINPTQSINNNVIRFDKYEKSSH